MWRTLHSRVDMWRHRGCMSCACPGRLEVSRGIVEAKHVTSGRHPSSAADLTNTNSCQLKSTHVTSTNCSRVTSLPHEPNWELEATLSFLTCRGIVEATHVTSDRHSSSAADLTNTNSCQLNSTHMTPTNCSRITSCFTQQ